MKRICFLCAFIFCILNAYAIPVFVFDEHRDTWNSVTYEKLDEIEQNYYAKLLRYEIEKYPTEYYDVINLQTIVLVKNLKFSGVFRAAVPDNYKKTLFLSVRDDYSDEYIKHVFHHEQNHYAEFAIWNDYRYKWDEWTLLFNNNNSTGGETAYANGEDRSSILYAPDLQSFLNKYSTLGQEEDRSEIIAFFMTDSKHAMLIQKAKNDAVFNKKVLCLLKLFSEKLFFPDLIEKYINELNR